MAYSSHYWHLSSRISTLRKRFLPAHFSKTGKYTADQLDGARAYRVLAHAELEDYIEVRALEIATDAVSLWNAKRKATRALVHLTSNQVGETQGLPKKLGTPTTAHSIVGKCFGQYKHVVRNNHGIRIPNLLQILLPIGLDEADLDSVWLATTDGFAASRGQAAHTSAVKYTIDPKTDFDTIQQIVEGLKDVDTSLSALKKSIR